MKQLIFILLIFISFSSFAQRDVQGSRVIALDSLYINGEWIYLSSPTNGQLIQRVDGRWVNNTVTGTFWDSLQWNAGSGLLDWYQGGSSAGNESLDGRYLLLSDTTDYLQFTDTISTIATQSDISGFKTMVYRITLPVNGTLSGSAAAATDVPSGWILSVSGGDLQVNHGLGRYASAVNISYNTSGNSYRQLRNFDNAYSGVLNVDTNNLTIESISNFYTAYALRITIIFE